MKPYKRRPLRDRLLNKRAIDEVTGCWVFTGARQEYGYGLLGTGGKGGKMISAHRAAYELFIGPIPPGCHVHHKCQNPPCFNPEHLEAVTPLQHRAIDERGNAQKTHCRHGHPLSGDNLAIAMGRNGRSERRCRRCAANNALRHYYANHEESRKKLRDRQRLVREQKRAEKNQLPPT